MIRTTTGAGRSVRSTRTALRSAGYAHIPGLRRGTGHRRGRPAHAAAALNCPDPVLLFEHTGLYNTSGIADESL
ncbi:hypothetical protein ACU686_09215 [Yinghuangia aomiensis]